MQSTDELSNILLKFKLIPLQKNSKLPIGQWKKNEYSPFDFVSKNKAIIIGDCYCVLDVEGTSKKVSGYERLRDLENQNQTLPDTLSWSTPSGGMAYLFKTSRPVPHSNMSQTVGLELRTGFHYHLIPDSEIDGKRYEWESITEIAEVPKWLVEFFEGTQNINKPAQASAPSSKTSSVVIEALYALNPNCSYEQWVKIGMACKASGMPLSAWQEWSSTAENACKDVGEYGRKWNSFIRDGVGPGTIIRMARETGWEPKKEEFFFPVAPFQLPEEKFITSFPDPAGLLKELKDYFVTVSKQEQYALGAALFCMNVVSQRSFRFAKATATNESPQTSYHCFFGESGSGKTSVMKAARNLLLEIDPLLMMDDPRSLANIKDQLHEAPSRFLYIDELGKDLQKNVYCSRPSPQEEAKYTELLKLHGGDKILAGHGTKGKDTKVKSTLEPRLSLMGSGTRAQFEKMLATPDFIDDGFFSRLCIWQGIGIEPILYTEDLDHFEYDTSNIIKNLKSFHSTFAQSDQLPNLIPVPHACRAYIAERANEFGQLAIDQERVSSTVTRHFGMGTLFSSLHALGCNRSQVLEIDAAFGYEVALKLLKQSLKSFELYSLDQVEQLVEAALKFLLEHGARDFRNIQQNCKAFRKATLDRKTKDEIHNGILQTGRVFKNPKDGRLTPFA